MKLIKLLVVLFTVNSFFAQEVKVKEESYSFNFGSKNAIVAQIPFGNKDVLEKELKSEMLESNHRSG